MPTSDPTTRAAIVTTVGALLACMGGGGQPQVCADYLACVGADSAATLMTLEPTYGEDGTCWSEGKDVADACEDACTTALTACESDADTDSDSDSDSDSDTDSDTDADSDADRDFTVTWYDNEVQIHVAGPTSGFDFGMADTGNGSSGWYGEDCLYGTGSYQMCHSFETHDGTLDSVYDEIVSGSGDISDVRESETTLFDDSLASSLTYIVIFDSGFCMVAGDAPWYYLETSAFADCEIR
jgi:hypothetical protein